MYLYFDKNGVLKEIITERNFRAGDSKRDKIYIYWDGDHSPLSGWAKYRMQNGVEYPSSNEEQFFAIGDSLVGKELPKEPLRNLKYFSYEHTYEENGETKVGYQFYELTVPNQVLNSYVSEDEKEPIMNNLVNLRVRFVMNLNGDIETLGDIAFSVEQSIGIITDQSVNISQYNYLITLISSKIGIGIKSYKVMNLPSVGELGSIYYKPNPLNNDVYDMYFWNGQSFVYLGVSSVSLFTKEDGEVLEIELNDKVDLLSAQLTTYIEQQVARIFTFKGSVQAFANLPNSDNVIGDYYGVIATNKYYAWNGTTWNEMPNMAIDSKLSLKSPNAVQNKVITKYVEEMAYGKTYCKHEKLATKNRLIGCKKGDLIKLLIQCKDSQSILSVVGKQNIATTFNQPKQFSCILKSDGSFTTSLSDTLKTANFYKDHKYAFIAKLSDTSLFPSSFQTFLTGRNTGNSNAIENIVKPANATVIGNYVIGLNDNQMTADGLFSAIWFACPPVNGEVIEIVVIDRTAYNIEEYTATQLYNLLALELDNIANNETTYSYTKIGIKKTGQNILDLASLTFSNQPNATFDYDDQNGTFRIDFTNDITSGGAGTSFGSNRITLEDANLKVGDLYCVSFDLIKSINTLNPAFSLVFLNSSFQQIETHRFSTVYTSCCQCKKVPDGAMYVQIALQGTTNSCASGNYVIFKNIQISLGSEPKEYEPYAKVIQSNVFNGFDVTFGEYTFEASSDNPIIETYGEDGFFGADLEHSYIMWVSPNGDLSEDNRDKNEKLEKKMISMSASVRAVAHRGLSYYAPENTLPAFKLAVEEGFAEVECDVRFTSDNVAVLCHDASIRRVSNGGNQNVSDLTYEQLLQYDFGAWMDSGYAGTTICTLEELLILAKKTGIRISLEIKDFTVAHITDVYNLVKRYRLLDKIDWIATSIYEAYNLLQLDNKMTILFEFGETAPTQEDFDFINEYKQLGASFIASFNYTTLTEQMIQDVFNEGLPINIWTVDGIETILDLDERISMVTSNAQNASVVLYKSIV